MSKFFMAIVAFLGGLSVIAGAFGSHALKGQLSQSLLDAFTTGTRYQMYHALALLLIGLFLKNSETPQPWMVATGFAFLIGILLFSGSLYGLSLTSVGTLGIITPVGGLILILGWGCLAIAALNS